MGGLGSGNYLGTARKTTVEESLAVSMRDFRGRLTDGEAGMLAWNRKDGQQWPIGYRIASHGGAWIATLCYCWGGNEAVEIPVGLQSTPTQFGGHRWWFTCPLTLGGVACNRRVAKLYLLPASKYFGCRTCHGLTYASCQAAHQYARFAASLARLLGGEVFSGSVGGQTLSDAEQVRQWILQERRRIADA